MDDVGKEPELAETQTHLDFIKRDNERCFLKDNQKLKYHSFILLEVIPLEKIDQLFNGLDLLYADVAESCSSRLEYRKILSEGQSKLFQSHTFYLPSLVSSKLKGKIPCVSCHDLGKNFREIDISISHPIPSTTILKINVHLEDDVSQTINEIIYKYHTEKRESIKHKEITKIILPENQKESEIYQLRKSLHDEAVNFLGNYFTGYFFELKKTIPSIVPTIDLFSLDLPSKDEELVKWGQENCGFLRCFRTYFGPFNCFRYENYLLTFESSDSSAHNNYLIFANRKESLEAGYCDVDAGIKDKINYCDLDLIAFDRFSKQQESHVGKLNLTLSQEIENIKINNFKNAIESRKEIIQTNFPFERFSVEFKNYRFFPRECKFYNLNGFEKRFKKIELFKGLQNEINARIKEINALKLFFYKEHETILSLKNLETDKRTQDIVLWLTVLIVILTILQLLLIIKGEDWNTIIKIIGTGFCYVRNCIPVAEPMIC